MVAQKDEVGVVSRQMIEMEIHMNNLAKVVERLEEAQDGTLRTRGLRDRILLAEDNIEANKRAFEKLDKHISEIEINVNKTLQEAFTEVTNNFNKKLEGIATEAQTQKNLLAKWQPYMNVIAWLTVGAGGIILTQILTGRLRIITP
jgi:hypothetical protein